MKRKTKARVKKAKAARRVKKVKAAPRAKKVKAAPRVKRVKAAPRAKKVKAAPRVKRVKAAPRVKKVKAARPRKVVLLVGTRKGAWLYHGDPGRTSWRMHGPHFLGQIFNHLVLDPRDRRTLLAAVSTGHLGPTLLRSTDLGKSWKEASRPPAFPKVPEGQKGRTVKHTFWLTPGHASEPGAWYAGTSPQGLFRSDDGGETWEPLPSINDDATMRSYFGSEQDGTPDGPKLHSINVDPRDAAHLYFAMSAGGIHESWDKGRTWKSLVQGMEVVDGLDAKNIAFHDPHCVRMSPANPDRLWQQNHCGVYRLDRPATRWARVGGNLPEAVGDIGFPMVPHPRDPDTTWVFPMDGSTVWPRTSPEGRPAVFVTRDGGLKWTRLDGGLPPGNAWWTVKRQAMSADGCDPVGLYFGTTSGELWASRDEGQRWSLVARNLPEIYSVEAAHPA